MAANLAKLCHDLSKGEKWVRAGLREAIKQGLVKMEGKARATIYRLTPPQSDQGMSDPESDNSPLDKNQMFDPKQSRSLVLSMDPNEQDFSLENE